jgi:hypothetical protein
MATDKGRHRETRLLVKRVLEDRFETVRSSHENGNLVLYSLLAGRSKGNATSLKEPDVIAYDENIFLIVEVETSYRPSTILGDVTSADAATHYALSPDEEPRSLPQCKVAVVVDSESLKERSSKLEQFALLEEAYMPFGAVGEFRVLTEKSFVSFIERMFPE